MKNSDNSFARANRVRVRQFVDVKITKNQPTLCAQERKRERQIAEKTAFGKGTHTHTQMWKIE